ncbi:DUF1203 domain-containing protein [Frigidibacter sp. ROC022]|uniref:DUF1203 domain-containing protein n=1 Tax=Frigidibacter sp. ROC022 TaxID=2971796 RepID=UPI00215A3593|nr:DUF1203 domain-containing protein [Frigidibacter sp. ROC022]MCR8726280.1 DUF1203 domain-containing protein [Frigidibacter sp. ROC022]
MPIRCHPYDAEFVARVRAGGPDAHGMPAERHVSDGQGNPCRACLHPIPEGAAMLILAARPFPEPQPYAETGPIFLCADPCLPWSGAGLPPILREAPDFLLKGYGPDNRIVYGTGRVVPGGDILARAVALLSDPGIAYVDVRSSRNNCFQTRITRANTAPILPLRPIHPET